MVTDNTQDRIEEVNNPTDPTLVTQHTANRDAVVGSTDHPRHGLDDSSDHDPEKGAALGGLGGAAVGAAAGSVAGPIGTVIGAVAGGLVGAGASGAAVAAVDAVDNDDTITGVGDGVTRDSDARRVTADPIATTGTTAGATSTVMADGVAVPVVTAANSANVANTNVANAPSVPTTAASTRPISDDPITPRGDGHNIVTGEPAETDAGDTGLAGGAVVGGVVGAALGGPVGAIVGGTLGSLAGGVAGDATEAGADETLMMDRDRGTQGYVPETEVASNPGVRNPGATTAGTPMTGVNPAIAGGTATGGDGHNVVTGEPATTEAGDDGLAGGAVVGGVVGAAVGGPVGAVIGGTVGSLAGGVAGDAAEAAADDETDRINTRNV